MKRPQSAKPGYRGPGAMQNSIDQIRDDEVQYKPASRKHVKLLKPDLTTNDFARIMPKQIFQDKQRLYSQGLQLKQKINQYQQENVRLKTRISILEKEKDKLTKAIDIAAESSNKSQSRFKMYQGPSKPSDADNTRIRNLTKIIRESKQENQYLRQENIKIKKAVKFTKINQVQIQCKILREEYQKLQQILTEMNQKLADQDDYEREINQLKNYLEQQVQENKQLAQANQKYVEYIEQLQDKIKKQGQKTKEKEIKLQRQLALNKRKLAEAIKISDDLRKQLRALKQSSQNIQKKKQVIPSKNLTRPMSSNPYSRPDNKQYQNANIQALKKLEQMRQKNQKLQKQLNEVKQKLQNSQKQNHLSEIKKQKKQVQQAKQNKNDNQNNLRLDSEPKYNDVNEDYEQDFIMSNSKLNKDEQKIQNKQKNDFLLKQQKKVDPEDEYQDQFQEQSRMNKKPEQKGIVDSHVEIYNKDFQQEAEQEQLYKKQNKLDKSKQKQKSKKKKIDKNQKPQKQKNKQSNNSHYEPDKKILTDIKQLLTYRMRAQRYPFDDLKNDILASKQQSFTYTDLQSMMKAEPFYLTPGYTKAFLEYVFESKDKSIMKKSATTQALLNKLKKVIKNFELLDEKQQEQKLMSIAQMTTQYPNQLQNAFEKIKNGPDTVSKKDLIQMFKKLELADHFIQIIISQLSLCSEDLQHLSIRGYFQRFYIDQMQNSNAIDQQQIESSGQQKIQSKNNKIHEIDEEQQYEDDKNYGLKDEAELSMRGKPHKNVDYNDDMVSDDGHI